MHSCFAMWKEALQDSRIQNAIEAAKERARHIQNASHERALNTVVHRSSAGIMHYSYAARKETVHENKVQRLVDADKERFAHMKNVRYERAARTLVRNTSIGTLQFGLAVWKGTSQDLNIEQLIGSEWERLGHITNAHDDGALKVLVLSSSIGNLH